MEALLLLLREMEFEFANVFVQNLNCDVSVTLCIYVCMHVVS